MRLYVFVGKDSTLPTYIIVARSSVEAWELLYRQTSYGNSEYFYVNEHSISIGLKEIVQ